jgi:hypothetical protein
MVAAQPHIDRTSDQDIQEIVVTTKSHPANASGSRRLSKPCLPSLERMCKSASLNPVALRSGIQGERRPEKVHPNAQGLALAESDALFCAWAAARTNGSYFQARRRGKKAIGAVAASLLRTIYHMLKDVTLSRISPPPLRQAAQDRLRTPPCPAPPNLGFAYSSPQPPA